MRGPGHPALLPRRSVRLLRLLAAVAVIIAVTAVAAILDGGATGRSRALVAAAILAGTAALIGMAAAAWPYIKKEKNDPRS